ncbi:MAG: hypothetical protein ACE5H1_06120, partial [Thermodesulfobacteriota bacterium]
NISRLVVGHDKPVPPLIQLLSPKLGLVEATLSDVQPYKIHGRNGASTYIYEAPLGANEKFFTIYAVDTESNVNTIHIQLEGCQGIITLVDDEVVLPEIFDIKYSI